MTTSVTNLLNSTNNSTLTNTAKGKSTLAKDDFLKLMMQQLKYQDPLSPMDGSQYAAQLAQFSSLEQLTNLNTSMDTSINANYVLTQSINNTLSATLVGKNVKLSGNSVENKGQSSGEIGYNLPANAKTATITIKNSDGVVVKTINSSELTQGDHKLSWDFSDNDGNKLPNGKYTYEVEATNSDGTALTATTFKIGKIDAIRFSDSGAVLVVDGTEYNLSDILEIVDSTSSGSSNGETNQWQK